MRQCNPNNPARLPPALQDYLEVFQEVTRLISTVHDPQQVMDLVVGRLPALLDVDAATIRLLDRATGTFVLGAAHGVSDQYLARATIDSREVMAALMAGRPTAMTDIDRTCDHDSCASIVREGVKSAMSLPILHKGQVIGLLRLLTKDSRRFTDSETGFAMSLAEQVGVAIANGRMFQELENQLQFFKELRQISRLVNSTLDLDRILAMIVEKLPGIMKVRACTIRLRQPATGRLELVAASGLSQEYLQRGSISGEDSIFKVLKGEAVAIYDAENDPRVDYHGAIRREGIKSILVVPIRNEREIIGVLRLLTDRPHLFSPTEINFASTVAEEGGNAIHKARTYRQITLLFNQIEEQERFIHTILDALWLELLVVTPDKRIILANRRFLAAGRRAEAETLGRNYHEVAPWQDADAGNCPITMVLAGHGPMTVLARRDIAGGTQWYERHLAPIVGDDGRVAFVVEAIRDVTSEKLLDQEKMARMKLEGVVEMAGAAAHNLNSPLFAALGTAQLLRDDHEDPELLAELDTIIRNLRNMAERIKEMTMVTGFESRVYVGNTKIAVWKTDNG